MTPEQSARFFELRKKSKLGELTEPEDVEYGGLQEARSEEVMNMIPVPTCCEAARTHPAIAFHVDYGDGDSHKAPGAWIAAENEVACRVRRMHDPYWHRIPIPPARFCPYCGTAVPKMRRKSPVPKTVCRIKDGGYYCSTCHERLIACLCDPLSSAFEPVP